MENWRDIVSLYPDNPEPKDYAKAIRSADTILSEDLAPFETEWLAHTLLFKPVGLFETITSKRTSEDWLKAIADSFKILSKIVEKYWEVVENYYNDIIELCMLSFDAQTRKEAILCLLCVVKHPSVELSDQVVSRHVTALEDARTCKAPLAQLVGTICRYHPERVQEHCTRIWRIYLNMLQPNSKTDQVVNSVLQGINGLFEYFGDDITTDQLNSFYDIMSRECIKISKCLEVLLSILKHHARLFKERLAGDRALRLYLWQIDTKNAMDALSNIYQVVFSEVQNVEVIINSEIIPRINSGSVLIKHTALRIIIQARSTSASIPSFSSGIDLEYQLRTKKLSYEEANTVSWCIGSSVSNSETMLLTAIMFYDNLPTSKKRDIIVNGVLNASDDVRKGALVLLLKLSLQENLDRYIDVWRALLDNTSGQDLAKAVLIFQDTVHHILEVLSTFTEDSEKVYADIKPVLSVLAVLLSLQKTEFSTNQWCQAVRPALVHVAKKFNIDPLKILSEVDENQIIYVEKFEEHTVLNRCSLAVTKEAVNSDTLAACQILFSKEDTELKVLSKVLSELELLMETENNNLDKCQLSRIVNQILKSKYKKVADSKDARIFHKDVAMFLGKYGHIAQRENFSEDVYVLKMKNKINLNVPNITEGTTFKLDLQRIFQLCLLWGETEALYTLLVILSANLCDRAEASVQEATVRVIHALLKANTNSKEAEISVYPALFMCNTVACTQSVMKSITEEPCPDVRRRLSECLEALLRHEAGSDEAGQLLTMAAEHAIFLITRDDASTIAPGLDITRAFLTALMDNNTLTIDYLPDILMHTANINEEIFQKASDIFIEKIDLFDQNQIKKTLIRILEMYAIHANTESSLNIILGFTKRVLDIKKIDPLILVENLLAMCKKLTIISPQFLNLVTILGSFNVHFDLDSELRRTVVGFENFLILKQLLKIKFELENNKLNGAFVFLKEFSVELNELDSEKTKQCIGHLIENIPQNSVFPMKKNLTACMSIYKSIPEYMPRIKSSYEKWTKKLALCNIVDFIGEKYIFKEFCDDFSDTIHALKIMSDLLEIPTVQARNLTGLLVRNASQMDLKWGTLFLSDLLHVSEKALTVSDFEKILENNLEFVKIYINVYFKRLIEKPFILKSDKSSLIVEIVECFARTYKEENFENVLDLVDNLWPTFEQESSFDDKLSVLLNLLRVPKKVGLGCPAVKWATTLLTTEGTKLEDKIKLIATLPAGEEYSVYYRTFASGMPVRLSELQGPYIASFRALLDSLATNGDTTLLDIVITLAGGDDSKGWWDFAIDACMTALAAKEDISVLDIAYRKAKSGASLGVCNRIFLPLLRHSSRKFCEKYMCSIVVDLFDVLRVGFKEPANNETYRKRLVSYAVAFNILRVAFEKITSQSLECGAINESAGSQKPWYFLEQTCKYCVTISANVKCPADATDELKTTCLWLQCSSYNCFAAAISRRKLSKNLCARIFNVHAWESIVDKDAVYIFELKAYARYRSSKPAQRAVDAVATSSSLSGSVRSRLFLTTLSEHPLLFDMIPEDEEVEDEEDDVTVESEDSVLNAHGCLSTVAALLQLASSLDYTEWRTPLLTALKTDVAVNVKWLLAQAICNAGEDLKPHADVLCPALLQLIADTPATNNGKSVLNNLHIDILSTIIKWNSTDLPHNSYLNITIEYLINTCMEYKHRVNVHRRLLNTLNGILQLYGTIIKVNWSVFQDYCKELPKDITPVLPVFERLLKNGVTLPDLLSAIFASSDPKQWLGATKLAEVCGLAFSLADSVTRDRFLAKFWPILNAVRGLSVNSYVKILFYTQKNCQQCCDFQNFKIITDLATKVEKSKCLSILSTYLENTTQFNDYITDMFQILSLCELFDGEQRVEAMKIARNSLKFMDEAMRNDVLKSVEPNCKSSSVAVRKEAYNVILKAFQDLVKREDHVPFKRKAVDSTLLLDTIDSRTPYEELVLKKLFDGMFDADELVSKMMTDGVEECLSKDINMRFAELFYIIVYQCSITYNDSLELSNCGSKLLDMLLRDLRSQDAFKVIKLRDEGLPQSVLKMYETITTKTYARTVQRSSVTYRQRITKAPPRREIDVQMPITDILQVFLQFAKTNSQICQELCVQTMKCLQGTGRRFDLDSVMSKQLFHIIKQQPNCLTPLVLDACRVFINGISRIPGFVQCVERFKQTTCNSEGYVYTNILYEDLLLRNEGRTQFILSFSMTEEDSDTAMKSQEFTLEGLIKVFGSLSNWDDLRLQDKRDIEDSLPPLWTTGDFSITLRQYFERANKKLDYGLWFNKMVGSFYPEEAIQDRISWLKQTEKWPRRDFVTSAIIEAIQWHQSEGIIVGDIKPSDCLAEWAARLMIRCSYYNQTCDSGSQDRLVKASRDELLWCIEANKRTLPHLALQCIERNKEWLPNVDILPWVQEKVIAYRTIGLKDNNLSWLQKALEAAEKQTMRFGAQSSLETKLSMNTLILQLHHDLGSLSKSKLDDVIKEVTIHIIRDKGRTLSSKDAQIFKSIYYTAMFYYDELWDDNDEITQNDIILCMSEIIAKMLHHGLTKDYNLLFSVLLNRLAYSDVTMSDITVKRLLEQIYRIFHHLDFFSVATLKKVIAVLPSNVLSKEFLNKLQDENLDVCKEYFQLICDANYALLQYCDSLRRNVLDDEEWKKTFNTMKKRLFESTHGGSDYQSLNTLKNRLYALDDMTEIDSKAKELKSIIDELRIKPQRSTLRLSQLCPDLCSPEILDRKKLELQRLLRLPPNVYVVKFTEQISVFTDSIRRPCVVRALLSTGATRRYICKSGEPMLRDASVQRAAAILSALHPRLQVRSYNVTPLSEDSAIIEYLEDHIRLRDLMEEKHDINVAVPRASNDKLILAPSLAIEQYNEMCEKVTPYILRSAIENNCSCVKEFIDKKLTFEDTLSSMTIINWLFGVGDRHLQNIMFSVRDGGVCGVDWASIFQYGCQELPPARLTANLLAVCDVKVLESRLQNMLACLRDSRKLFGAYIRTSFYWLAPEFNEIKHLNNILEGKSVSYGITRECLDDSNRKYKSNYLALLDLVFEEFPQKDVYSTEEQVSCLLQHCTDPRILAVSPQGWEAWL